MLNIFVEYFVLKLYLQAKDNKITNSSDRFIFQYQSGFSYMGLLAIIAIAGIGMAGTGIVWHQDAQREGEKELLFIGEQYRNAIASYHKDGPDGAKQFPATLNDLVLDKRFASPKRHIRQLYDDPFYNSANVKRKTSELFSLDSNESSKNTQWGLVLQESRITGVHSLSTAAPIKKAGFSPQNAAFGDASQYSEWVFNFVPASAPVNNTQSTKTN